MRHLWLLSPPALLCFALALGCEKHVSGAGSARHDASVDIAVTETETETETEPDAASADASGGTLDAQSDGGDADTRTNAGSSSARTDPVDAAVLRADTLNAPLDAGRTPNATLAEDACVGCGSGTCGDGVVNRGEECDPVMSDPNCVNCQRLVVNPVCGDGRTDHDEECDDGNTVDDDACDNLCRSHVCGDGFVRDGEGCDPPGADCNVKCQTVSPTCGDGVVQADAQETCDDANDVRGDGCYQCLKECGNGKVEPLLGETCEPSSGMNQCRRDVQETCLACTDMFNCEERDRCNPTTCQTRAVCGDGAVETRLGESCDPPNSTTCSQSCLLTVAVCGNGVREPGEQCEPPDGLHCSADCQYLSCGNDVVEGTEECDSPDRDLCDDGCTLASPCRVQLAPSVLPSDGTFTNDTQGFRTDTSAVALTHIADDGARGAGALSVTVTEDPLVSDPQVSGAVLCLPVSRNTVYDFNAYYRFPTGSSAESGASAALFIYATDDCMGSPIQPALSRGPRAVVSEAWTPYAYTIDTSVVGDQVSQVSVAIRLDVWRPATVAEITLLWDDVRLAVHVDRSKPYCGDCAVSGSEQCDDGNQVAGDGCSDKCMNETCGDGVVATGEPCGDGNAAFGDTAIQTAR